MFQHDFTGTAVLWTPNSFDDEEGKFTFAVFSGLTGRERDEIFDVAIDKTEGREAFTATKYGQSDKRKNGRIGTGQAKYFRRVIEKHPEVRWTFLLMHKPAWKQPDEEIFSSIEKALEDQPYTVFHGHNHSYLYTLRHGRDYVRLGTTGGGHAPDDPMAIDHDSLITVSTQGVDIANLRLSGIFDKTGKLPLNGEQLCFADCTMK